MASIKIYDKFGHILRIETTAKDVSFFKHYREVEQHNGQSMMKFASVKKTTYSLGALRELLSAANRRYLEFLSAIDDPSSGVDKPNKITRGFNFLDQDDHCYKYYLTPFGKHVIALGLKLKELVIIPELANQPA